MRKDGTPNVSYELEAINGRTWLATELLTYTVSSVVRWRIAHGGLEPHAMHLHGFPFTVDAVGDGVHALSLTGRSARRKVTERLEPFQTFAMRWRAARAGMWMFHCHGAPHILAHSPMAVLVAGRRIFRERLTSTRHGRSALRQPAVSHHIAPKRMLPKRRLFAPSSRLA